MTCYVLFSVLSHAISRNISGKNTLIQKYIPEWLGGNCNQGHIYVLLYCLGEFYRNMFLIFCQFNSLSIIDWSCLIIMITSFNNSIRNNKNVMPIIITFNEHETKKGYTYEKSPTPRCYNAMVCTVTCIESWESIALNARKHPFCIWLCP